MTAVISPCELFRYRLERDLGGLFGERTAAFIMLNPSTADATLDDQTIRRARGYSERAGCKRLLVGNLFAFRATEPRDMFAAQDPIGPENDRHVEQILRDADLHVVAWGDVLGLPPQLRDRWRSVVAIADRVGCELRCLGSVKSGHPKHPSRGAYVQLVPWARPAERGVSI